MKRPTIRTAAEAAGIVALLASLVFLAMEIKQSNKIAIATIQYDILSDFNEYHRAAPYFRASIESAPSVLNAEIFQQIFEANEPPIQGLDSLYTTSRQLIFYVGTIAVGREFEFLTPNSNNVADKYAARGLKVQRHETYADVPTELQNVAGLAAILDAGDGLKLSTIDLDDAVDRDVLGCFEHHAVFGDIVRYTNLRY